MNLLRVVFCGVFLCVSISTTASRCDAQGLLRRLRNRIAPRVQNPTPPRTTPQLPARPLPRSTVTPSNPSPTNPQQPKTAAKPATGSSAGSQPTVADDQGVRRASAQAKIDAEKSDSGTASGFGRSILKPLDFPENQPSAEGQASLGIRGRPANPGYPAVQIVEILPHSTLGKIGLKNGDYIFAIEGVPTPQVAVLADEIRRRSPGDKVRLRVGQNGRVVDLDALLVSHKVSAAGSGQPTSGIQPIPKQSTPLELRPAPPIQIGADLSDVGGRRGVMVDAVASGSNAQRAGFVPGDRIVAINGKMVSDRAKLQELLSAQPDGENADVQLIRNNELVNVALDLSESLQAKDKSAAGTVGVAPPTESEELNGAKTAKSASGTESGKSALGGLGSMIGGFFGSGGNKPADADKSALELPAPPSDPLALPQPPSSSPDSSAEPKQKEPAAIQSEIKQLRDRLRELESKLKE